MIALGHTAHFGLVLQHGPVEDVRRSYCRAIWNCYHAEFSFAINHRMLVPKVI
jgi:hypothetical protein